MVLQLFATVEGQLLPLWYRGLRVYNIVKRKRFVKKQIHEGVYILG
jgi:hypothetical protein